MKLTTLFSRSLRIMALAVSVGFSPIGQAQFFDNFDSGALAPGWQRSHFDASLVQLTFPDTGMGKGVRIRANPFAAAGAPAAALLYRPEVYTDFYMAVDVVDWPGTDKNQAIVLLARAHITASPLDTTGIIFNYDASQYGEGATSRRQGQLQINLVTNDPPFGTKTICVAELTLQPGRGYRFTFEGVGTEYVGQVYDLQDLTKPIVTLHADDEIQRHQSGGGNIFFEGGFTSGMCGLISFSREGVTGTTDVTIDNFFAGPANPNPAAGTALAHPVAGTPTIDTRTPADRFENFHNPTAGISFTAKTYTDNVINASATKVRLNGVDVSSQLQMSADGTSITGTLPGSALLPNMIYAAQIEVEDVSGTRKSTNSFWFDTFSEAFLKRAGVKVIEAEEYNYDNGKFQNDPIPVSGYTTEFQMVNGNGVGYVELIGMPGVDYFDKRGGAESPWTGEYRSLDPVGLSMGMYPEVQDLHEVALEPVRRSDHVRQQYAETNLLEYVVHRTEPGEWLNYTRQFEAGTYQPHLRVASFGATAVELHRVTSDPKVEDQTTVKLGTFRIPNNMTRYNYTYVPLTDDNGVPATVDLGGEQTLRLLMAGVEGQDARKIAINYLLLAPQAQNEVAVLSATSVTGAFAPDAGVTVNTENKTITIPVGAGSKFFLLSAGTARRVTGKTLSGNTLTLTYE